MRAGQRSGDLMKSSLQVEHVQAYFVTQLLIFIGHI